MDNLSRETLKNQIICTLNLEELTPADIADDAPLFGGGLGLDSIDALELILLMEREYGIRVATAAEARPILASVETMAQYIDSHRQK